MKSIIKISPLLFLGLFFSPEVAHAHLIGGNGLTSGITHPLFGLDHLLAMVAVGIISTQISGKAIWKIPATFVVFMIIGALLAIGGIGMPIAETGIALSILFLGASIAYAKNIPIHLAILCVALFAVFHGHAHGDELPAIASPALYATGFLLSTTLLHIMGVLIGHYAHKTQPTLKLLHYAGAGMSVMGLFFLFGY